MAQLIRSFNHSPAWMAWVSLILPFTLAFPVRVNSVSITLVVAVFLVTLVYQNQLNAWNLRNPYIALTGAHYLILAIGLSHSLDFRLGLFELEKNLSLILLPSLVYHWRFYGIRMQSILWAFAIGCTSVTAYGFFYITFILDDSEARMRAFQLGHSYYSQYIGILPSYLAPYLVLIIFFVLVHLRENWKQLPGWRMILEVVLMAYTIALLVFLRSRTSLILFPVLSVAYVIVSSKKLPITITMTAFFVGLMLVILMKIVDVRSESSLIRNPFMAFKLRMSVWKSAYEGAKLAPLIGAGTGSAQRLIDEGYLKTGHDEGLDNAFHAHNQYLQYVCRNGVVELSIFLSYATLLLVTGIRRRQQLFVIFMATFLLSMVTDSMLSSQKGIVFFYFFSSAFYFLEE